MSKKRPGNYQRIAAKAASLGILVLFILQIGCFVWRYQGFEKILRQEIDQDLMESTQMSEDILLQVLQETKQRLRAIAALCDLPDGSGTEDFWPVVAGDSSAYKIGVVSREGIVYYGEHQQKDVSGSRALEQVLQGQETQPELLEQAFADDPQHSALVMAVPIVRDGQTQGGVWMEYSVMALGGGIQTYDIRSIGATLVLDSEGRMIASYEGMEKFSTFYEMMEKNQFTAGISAEELKKRMNETQSGYWTYYGPGNDKARYVYYQKAGQKDWIILTLVMQEGYDELLIQMQREAMVVFSGIVITSAGIFILGVVTYRLRAREKQRMMRDPLTQVYTRSAAGELLRRDLMIRKKEHFNCCMFVDVDSFKEFNDTMGHEKGDEVLAETAGLLIQEARRKDLVSRFGGDEFNVWCYNVAGQEEAVKRGESLVQVFREKGSVRISVGVTLFQPQESYEEILGRADRALYQAKEKGRNQSAFL